MRIAFGTDERTPLTDWVVERLRSVLLTTETVAGELLDASLTTGADAAEHELIARLERPS